MLSIRVLGAFEALADGAPLELPPVARVRSLLAWLAVHPGLHSRGALAGRLRPDALDESARKSLRQAVWSLRAALGAQRAAWLVSERDQVGLAPDRALVLVDLGEFRRLRDEGALEEALALARGDLLPGLDDEWVHAARDEHRAEVVALLGELVARADAAGDAEAAIGWARRRAGADPLSESAARDLIGRLAAAGDRAGALAAHEALRERLRRDLGIVPSAETRELVEQVRRGRPAALPAGTGATHPPLPPPLGAPGELVGRREPLARLEAAWRDAAGGAVRIACVGGEPGIGKTRLAAELAVRAHRDGAVVMYGRCDEETLVPHQPFVEALERLLRALPAEEREGLLGPHRAELSRVLPALDPGAEVPAAGDAETSRYRAFEAVRELIEAASVRRPALLVLDDLHWADGPSLGLLRHLSRMAGRARLLVLGTFRDTEVDAAHPLSRSLADLRRDRPLTTLTLAGLGDAEAADLLARGGVGDRTAAEPLVARARGNPFFLEELARHLAEAGSDAAGGLPPGVKDVIGRRVERLGEEAAAVLASAALIGAEFDLGLVEALHDPDVVLDALERAAGAGLVAEVAGPPGRYAFAHTLVAETLQEGLSAARAARLHRRIGAALELAAGDPAPHAAELARHALAAGDAEQAVRWSLAAADRAGSLLADEEAAGHLGRALAVLPPDDFRRAGLLAALGVAHDRAGARAAARAAFEEAAALAREAGDAEGLARAALGAGGLSVTIRPADAALVELLEGALAGLGPGRPALRARLLGRLATELYYADRARAGVLSLEAVACAQEAGEPGALAVALNARRVAIWDIHHVEERLAVATEIVAAGRQAGDPGWVLQGRNWRVLDLLELGRIEEAEAEIEVHAREADALGLPHHRWYAPLWRGCLALLRGDQDAARRHGDEALALGRRADDANAELFVELQRAQALVERGAFDEVDIDAVAERAEESPAAWAWKIWLAWVMAERGREEEARAIVDELARDDFAAVSLDANWHATMDLCEVLAALGDRERAATLYRLLAPFSGLVAVVARGAACYGPVDAFLGLLATTAGRPADAERHLVAAVEACERLGAAPRAAIARARLRAVRSALSR